MFSLLRLRHSALLIFALLAALFRPLAAAAQDEEYYTKEVGFGLGTSSLIGDTNSQPFGEAGFGIGGTLRFVRNARSAISLRLNYNRLSGEHLPTEDFYTQAGNGALSQGFSYRYGTHLVDLSTAYELHFLPYGFHRSYLGYRRFVPFVQIGVGLAYSSVGKSMALSFPLGIGVKYKIAPRLNLIADWRMNFTTSDRLDGLSAPTTIDSEMFRNKDHFGQCFVTLTYDFSPHCPTCNKAD